MNKQKVKKDIKEIAITGLVTTSMVGSLFCLNQLATAPEAKATPDAVGCQVDKWGFLATQRRTVCDTARAADGSWTRSREIWVPAGYVPGYCSGSYYITCTQGYYRQRGTVAFETYPVTDTTVLPDEPGWLPPGTTTIK